MGQLPETIGHHIPRDHDWVPRKCIRDIAERHQLAVVSGGRPWYVLSQTPRACMDGWEQSIRTERHG